ncbi:MAG: FGGY-family carbohydrate kinase [Planctomycetia bacterium]|nr:FGGY-family carbohydrate kinase [Planctomycetia bacterium]
MLNLPEIQENKIITGWDFSTGAVKCIAFDLQGNVVAECRFPTDLWYGGKEDPGAIELNLLQLEGQARQTTRTISERLREKGRLTDWIAGGISATHHTAGRIDKSACQLRRAICWNDQSLAKYHEKGIKRLGGEQAVRKFIGGPWSIRYTLSHLVKDEEHLPLKIWENTWRILPHGGLAAGFLTGNFDVLSVSAAASTGMMDFRTRKWCREMLGALESDSLRKMAWNQLPRIIDSSIPVGNLSESLAVECALPADVRPVIFPTSDDQQAGLVGGGAVRNGQIAIILGNSAVVNSSCDHLPPEDARLDVMALNWGDYLYMRCYSNGAYFMDRILEGRPDFACLEKEARKFSPGANGTAIMPFLMSEPSLGVMKPCLEWVGTEPENEGQRFRACLEALAYLIALGVREHQRAGQKITQITVSGGVAKSDLMCEILASVLNLELKRLVSEEGPALGAAITALAGMETENARRAGIFPEASEMMENAVSRMVRFRETVPPKKEWVNAYHSLLADFEKRLDTISD